MLRLLPKTKKMKSLCSLVLMFLLGKDQFCFRVLLTFPLEEIVWEGADLLDGGDGDLFLQGCSPSSFHQVMVDLQGNELRLIFKTNLVLTERLLTLPEQKISF